MVRWEVVMVVVKVGCGMVVRVVMWRWWDGGDGGGDGGKGCDWWW